MKYIDQKKTIWHAVALFLTASLMFALFLHIFTAQLYNQDGLYKSDIHTHIKFALNGTGYSLLYRVMGWLQQLTGTSFSIAVMEALLVVGTWLLSAKWLNVMYAKRTYFYYAMTSLPVIGLAGIYLPTIYECFYKQQLVTQPQYHLSWYALFCCGGYVVALFGA